MDKICTFVKKTNTRIFVIRSIIDVSLSFLLTFIFFNTVQSYKIPKETGKKTGDFTQIAI